MEEETQSGHKFNRFPYMISKIVVPGIMAQCMMLGVSLFLWLQHGHDRYIQLIVLSIMGLFSLVSGIVQVVMEARAISNGERARGFLHLILGFSFGFSWLFGIYLILYEFLFKLILLFQNFSIPGSFTRLFFLIVGMAVFGSVNNLCHLSLLLGQETDQ